MDRPVKAACLACRGSKTRCDGQNPCKPCLNKSRGCFYRPSRRGGPRKSTRSAQGAQRPVEPRPVSQTDAVVDVQQHQTPSAAEIQTPVTVEPSLWDTQTLLSPLRRILDPNVGDPWSASRTEIPGPVLRIYTSEEKILDAYYHFFHSCLPLLPPAISRCPDDPTVFQPSREEAYTVGLSALLYQPTTSLGLALAALLTLIPHPQDQTPSDPCSVTLRRSFGQLFAQAAFHTAEKEIEDSAVEHDSYDNPVEGQWLHPHMPPQLHPVLAFVALSVYEYCQRGNISRMRMRANQAVTTAIDYSLHQLNEAASEAQRRTWWTAVGVTHMEENSSHSSMIGLDYVSVIHCQSPPIITITDPRLTTPYPIFDVQDKMSPQPWSLLLKTEDAYTRVSAIVNPTVTNGGVSTSEGDLRDQIRRLDAHILSIAKDCDFEFSPTDKATTEERAAHGLGLITRVLIHSARIKLHRFRAFADIPIFLEKHCDLTFIKLNDLFPQPGATQTIPGLDEAFPFTREVSSVACLKSSLAVSRALKNFSYPNASPLFYGPGKHNASNSDATNTGNSYIAPYPGTLPYFQCTGMQACYSLYMLVHQVRAALSSKRLAICYPFMNHPEPETEFQDAERLLEELRRGCHDIIYSMRLDLAYESIASMTRDLDGVYLALFPG